MYRGMAKKFSHNHGTLRKITTKKQYNKKIKIVTTNAHTYRDGKKNITEIEFGGGGGAGGGGPTLSRETLGFLHIFNC